MSVAARDHQMVGANVACLLNPAANPCGRFRANSKRIECDNSDSDSVTFEDNGASFQGSDNGMRRARAPMTLERRTRLRRHVGSGDASSNELQISSHKNYDCVQ